MGRRARVLCARAERPATWEVDTAAILSTGNSGNATDGTKHFLALELLKVRLDRVVIVVMRLSQFRHTFPGFLPIFASRAGT